MDLIENRTFDEIKVGDTAKLERTLTEHDIMLFAVMSGDINPAHVDPEYAMSSRFREVIGHGMWSGALISTVLGTVFPGPGTIYLGQELRFRRPVKVGDTITIKVTAREKDPNKGKLMLDTECTNQDGEVVVSGTAEVIAPKEKVQRPKVYLPVVHFDDKEMRFREIMGRVKARMLAPVATAIVNPAHPNEIASIAAAAEFGTIVPILIGTESVMREGARAGSIDLDKFEIMPAKGPREAIAMAIRLAREGRIEGIMKGGVSIEELIGQIISTNGLRTERRVSHVHVLDLPTYSKPLFITDSMINIAPGLSEKREICQNAIDLAHGLGIPAPKVAVLAAVETINPKMPATIHAATLCKMAERGQISGGILDGPLTVDHAVSLRAAAYLGISSAVAGRADILLAPDLESGNMIAKELSYFADALSAGIVLGARVPLALTSHGDDRHSWLASAALVQIVAHMYRRGALEGPATGDR